MNKLLMVENDHLQKQVSHLVYENGYMRTQLQSASATTIDNNYGLSSEATLKSGHCEEEDHDAVKRRAVSARRRRWPRDGNHHLEDHHQRWRRGRDEDAGGQETGTTPIPAAKQNPI
ncbi:hypothetical protein LWI29_000632 [Acer saccharum]|uniref:Uncharacterized protein n=1 Tax=Acer saccharum TaxID=4024 RepID=A0AA39SBU6_ACESA|nr:hypothetical protein LWI29_000632 [Acer saccharum]